VDGGYQLNGSKIYITNGYMADVTVVVAKTDVSKGAHGMSLFLLESGTKVEIAGVYIYLCVCVCVCC
jgi:alkylation response protein AidB-like acyl-CoA dehydrogenase